MKAWKAAAIAALAITSLSAVPAGAEQPDYPNGYADDRAEIEDLFSRYLFAIDFHDWDAYIATFAPDATLEFASGAFVGHDAIRQAVTSFSQRIGQTYKVEDGSPARLRHVVLHSTIRIEGDRAWATSLWVEMANDGPGDTLKMGTYGVYEDELAKIDGQWLLTYRNVLNDFIKGREPGPRSPVAVADDEAEAYRDSIAP